MKTITMLEFRRNASVALREILKGHQLLLTYRGKPVAQLQPVKSVKRSLQSDDALFQMLEKAEKDLKLSTNRSLTNKQIDQILYGNP